MHLEIADLKFVALTNTLAINHAFKQLYECLHAKTKRKIPLGRL